MTSYIKYKSKGFWINDSLMQFALGYLYCWFKNKNKINNNQDFYNILLDNSLGCYASFMHLKLENTLTQNEFDVFKFELLELVYYLNGNASEFNIHEKKEIYLKNFCNYDSYKDIEYYMPDKMNHFSLSSIYLKLLFILQE